MSRIDLDFIRKNRKTMTIAQFAEKFGVSSRHISKICNKNKISLRKGLSGSDIRYIKIHAKTMCAADFAKKFGVHRKTIYATCSRHNIAIKSVRGRPIKYPAEIVIKARSLRAEGKSNKETAELTGLPVHYVRDISRSTSRDRPDAMLPQPVSVQAMSEPISPQPESRQPSVAATVQRVMMRWSRAA